MKNEAILDMILELHKSHHVIFLREDLIDTCALIGRGWRFPGDFERYYGIFSYSWTEGFVGSFIPHVSSANVYHAI